jgi:zinc D-Ala-D-Ala carboxypeptidase
MNTWKIYVGAATALVRAAWMDLFVSNAKDAASKRKKAMTATTMLSKNFSVKELKCKCGCGMLPNPEFVQKLQQLRDLYGRPMHITSAARCPKHNAAVKGSKNSMHMQGRGADIACSSGQDRIDLIRAAMQLGFGGLGLHKGFIHVDDRDWSNRTSWFY